jgi:hypothetical protein
MRRTKILLSIPLVFAFLVSGCGLDDPKYTRDLNLVIEGDNPPKFRISGQGKLDILYVSGPDLERKAPEGGMPYWKDYWGIMPKGKYDISSFEKLGPVLYGQVPEGFNRVYPEQGDVTPLFEGGTFAVRVERKDGRVAGIRFTIRNGEIVAIVD